MNYLTWILINGPLAIFNIMANAFYIFCMIYPLHGEKIKQPLKLLLSSLICSTIAYSLIIFAMFISGLLTKTYKFIKISVVVSAFCLSMSINSSVWLNFFYYTHIVPAERPLFIWIKKNIKSIIYCVYLADRFYSLLDLAIMLSDFIPDFGLNNTHTVDHEIPARFFFKWLKDILIILVSIVRAYFYFCVCVMVISSSATVVYLYRHIRRMAGNGKLLSSPRYSSQLRVTVTGILQGVLYTCCVGWLTYIFVSYHLQFEKVSPYALKTVFNFYLSGTTFNLGAGQAVFRQRAVDIWVRIAQWCKTPKVQQSDSETQASEFC